MHDQGAATATAVATAAGMVTATVTETVSVIMPVAMVNTKATATATTAAENLGGPIVEGSISHLMRSLMAVPAAASRAPKHLYASKRFIALPDSCISLCSKAR